MLAGSDAAGTYVITGNITIAAGAASKQYKIELVKNATHLDNNAFEVMTSGTDHQSGSATSIVAVSAGDRIWMQIKNETDAQDVNYEHSGVVLFKL